MNVCEHRHILSLLTRFSKYPVIALIATVAGVIIYTHSGNVVTALGYSLVYTGVPLVLIELFDIFDMVIHAKERLFAG